MPACESYCNNETLVERRRALQNRLLRALPPDDYRRIAPHLKHVRLNRGQVLLQMPSASVEHVYFPKSGVCCVQAVTETGRGMGIAMIGCEGLTGIHALLSNLAPVQFCVQVCPWEAEWISVDRFAKEMDRRGALRQAVTEYYRMFFSDVVQSVACNRLHSTRERCCRKLLAISDRVGSHAFKLTHDMLGMMLGIQRPAVSVIAFDLKHAGLIEYTRGAVTIVDRRGLEAGACECYRAWRDRVAHLLPPTS
jgi:CRP-like cAMP-binding protein